MGNVADVLYFRWSDLDRFVDRRSRLAGWPVRTVDRMAVLTPEVTGPLPTARVRTRPRWFRHLPFGILVALAAALRVVAMIAYNGILWFPDGHSYLTVAVRPIPYPARPMGYAFFLHLLEPFHSLAFVAGVQHAMGLAAGVIVYAVLRRFGTPGWVATLCAVPVLFDAYQLELEHLLLSDTLFWFLVVVAAALVICRPDSWPAMAGAGLALGAASLTRSVGLPLLVIFAVYLLVRRRWRVAAILAGACLAPMAAYAVWFHATWDTYAMTNSDGIFLYGRTAAFADCRVIQPPANERDLCPAGPPASRRPSPDYIWHVKPLGPMANYRKFTPATNARAGDFARRAILAQPGAYLATGLSDFGKTFAPARVAYPNRHDVELYEFPVTIPPQKKLSAHPLPWRTLGSAIATYTGDPHSDGAARMNAGAAAFIRGYQRVAYLPGPVLALILVGGGVAMLVRRRGSFGRLYWRSGDRPVTLPLKGLSRFGDAGPEARPAGPGAALAWVSAVTLLVVPPFTAVFDHRYVIPAVPLACLALGLAVARRRSGPLPE